MWRTPRGGPSAAASAVGAVALLFTSAAMAYSIPQFDPQQHVYFVPDAYKGVYARTADAFDLSSEFFATRAFPFYVVIHESVGGQVKDAERIREATLETARTWAKAQGFDPDRTTVIGLTMRERSISMLPGIQWLDAGFEGGAVQAYERNHFVPHARDGRFNAGLGNLVERTDDYYGEIVRNAQRGLTQWIDTAQAFSAQYEALFDGGDIQDLRKALQAAQTAVTGTHLRTMQDAETRLRQAYERLEQLVAEIGVLRTDLNRMAAEAQRLLEQTPKHVVQSYERSALEQALTRAQDVHTSRKPEAFRGAIAALQQAMQPVQQRAARFASATHALDQTIADAKAVLANDATLLDQATQAERNAAAQALAEAEAQTATRAQAEDLETTTHRLAESVQPLADLVHAWQRQQDSLVALTNDIRRLLDEQQDLLADENLDGVKTALTDTETVLREFRLADAPKAGEALATQYASLQERINQLQKQAVLRTMGITFGSGVALFAGLFAAVAAHRRRRRLHLAMEDFDEVAEKLEQLVDRGQANFAEILSHIEADKPNVLGLRDTQGETRKLYDQMEDLFATIGCGLAGMKDRITTLRTEAHTAGFWSPGIAEAAVDQLKAPLDIESNSVAQIVDLFGPTQRTVQIKPKDFLDGLGADFRQVQKIWQQITVAVEASLREDAARQDFTTADLDGMRAKLTAEGLSHDWVAQHLLAHNPQATWNTMEAVRTVDPIGYVNLLAQHRATDDRLEEVVADLVSTRQTLRDAAEKVNDPSVMIDFESTTIPTAQDPRAREAALHEQVATLQAAITQFQPAIAEIEAIEAFAEGKRQEALVIAEGYHATATHRRQLQAIIHNAPTEVDSAARQIANTESEIAAAREQLTALLSTHSREAAAGAYKEIDEANADVATARARLTQARDVLAQRRHFEAHEMAAAIAHACSEARADIADFTKLVQTLDHAKEQYDHILAELQAERKRLAKAIQKWERTPESYLDGGDSLYTGYRRPTGTCDWGHELLTIMAIQNAWHDGHRRAEQEHSAEMERIRAEERRLLAAEEARVAAERRRMAENAKRAREKREREAARSSYSHDSGGSRGGGSSWGLGGGGGSRGGGSSW